MYCAQCGIPIRADGRFCTGCGTVVSTIPAKPGGLPQAGQGIVSSTIPPHAPSPQIGLPLPEHSPGGRFARLLAVGIDAIVAIPVLFVCYAASGFDTLEDTIPLLTTLFLGLCGVVMLQGLFLAFRAQTIGKMLLGLRIIDVATGRRAGFARLVFLRMLVTSLLSALAGIGWIFGLIDCLFIFRDDRRCLHDFIAGTRVVRATRDN